MSANDQDSQKSQNLLPENAYRELKPGESYMPIISQETGVPEVTRRSVIFGLLMIVIFSAAAAYIALKLGQGIETAIPIGILAVGFSAVARRKSSLIENVNILAIGATSGIVVGGSVFVMPAIFMLGLDKQAGTLQTFLQIFLVPFLGAVLGVLFLIPFRKYFTTEMHGKLPFPEGTATTEILVAGEKGGDQAKVLVYSLGIGIVVDYLALAFKTWSDTFTTALVFKGFTQKVKGVFAMNTSAAVLGLGVIIGLKYASIIMAGSMLSYFVLIPLFGYLNPACGAASYRDVFFGLKDAAGAMVFPGVRNIGIGGIFAAGVISIVKMAPVIKQALQQVLAQLFKKHGDSGAKTSRLDLDMKMTTVFALAIALAVAILVYFWAVVMAGQPNAFILALLSLILTFLIVFLFSAVSAWAVAMISVTPISGMTLTTLIIAAVTLAALGLKGGPGMLAILLIGGVVCTALSMSGSLVTQFKVGYWLGSTPKSIQWSNILGSALASFTVTAVIMLFAHVYGYGTPTPEHANPLPAPQAGAMAAVANAFMGGQDVPWMLYGIGAVVAVIVSMLGISALAFALGMYLPIELNSPILLGAIVGWLVQKSATSEALSKARADKAILVASGFIAGGALAGVFDGITKMFVNDETFGFSVWMPSVFTEDMRNWVGLLVFLALAAYLYWDARKAKADA
jgi:putative OPT family oligopeptide transporter